MSWVLLHCNKYFLFTTFKESARNEFLQLENVSYWKIHYFLRVKFKLNFHGLLRARDSLDKNKIIQTLQPCFLYAKLVAISSGKLWTKFKKVSILRYIIGGTKLVRGIFPKIHSCWLKSCPSTSYLKAKESGWKIWGASMKKFSYENWENEQNCSNNNNNILLPSCQEIYWLICCKPWIVKDILDELSAPEIWVTLQELT
jgi:hypothetical protein